MSQSHLQDDPLLAKALLRLCGMCGFPMFLSVIEPSHTPGQDSRTFECVACSHADTVTVSYR
jgi:hypothetical protein